MAYFFLFFNSVLFGLNVAEGYFGVAVINFVAMVASAFWAWTTASRHSY